MSPYQLAFTTPGIFPSRAIFLKQMRQMPNFRRNARGRPQIWQRLWARTANLGFLFAFTTIASRANCSLLSIVLVLKFRVVR